MVNSTISMAIFNSYVKLPEGTFSVTLAFILWPPGSGFNDSWGLGEGVGAHPLVGELYGVLPSTAPHRSAPFNMRANVSLDYTMSTHSQMNAICLQNQVGTMYVCVREQIFVSSSNIFWEAPNGPQSQPRQPRSEHPDLTLTGKGSSPKAAKYSAHEIPGVHLTLHSQRRSRLVTSQAQTLQARQVLP